MKRYIGRYKFKKWSLTCLLLFPLISKGVYAKTNHENSYNSVLKASLYPVNSETIFNILNKGSQSVIINFINTKASKSFNHSWVDVSYNSLDLENKNNVVGATSQSFNFILGQEFNITPNNTMGSLAAVTLAGINSNAVKGISSYIYTGHIQTSHVGLYNKYNLNKHIEFKELALYSISKIHINRSIVYVNKKGYFIYAKGNKSDPKSNNLNLLFLVKYHRLLDDYNTNTTPTYLVFRGGMNYEYSYLNSYREQGYNSFYVNKTNSNLVTAMIGLYIKVDPNKIKHDLSTKVGVDFGYNIINKIAKFEARSINSIKNITNKPIYSSLYVTPSIKLDYIVNSNFLVDFELRFKESKNYNNLFLNLGLAYKL